MESSGLIILISSLYVVKYTNRRVLRREKPRSPAFSSEALRIIYEISIGDIWYYLPGEERYPDDF